MFYTASWYVPNGIVREMQVEILSFGKKKTSIIVNSHKVIHILNILWELIKTHAVIKATHLRRIKHYNQNTELVIVEDIVVCDI